MELKDEFNLEDALRWGTLPELTQLTDSDSRINMLESYAQTYLREEILIEQIVRKLPAFRRFLEVAAQMNGEIINIHSIAKQVGAEDSTSRNYFEVLEDTLAGTLHHSVESGSFEYGKRFEHFMILEFLRLGEYLKTRFQFSFLRTKDDAEVDLVIERPNQKLVLVEIKSTARINESHTRHLRRFKQDLSAECYVLSQDPIAQVIDGVTCLPWRDGIREILEVPPNLNY